MKFFIHFDLTKTKANNTDFRTGKPVNTAPDWTGHIMSSANHCTRIPAQTPIVCKQDNNLENQIALTDVIEPYMDF